MKTIVISLGGSLIIPDKINHSFLKKFKKTLRKNYKKNKFVIVCGGGAISRKYISLLRKQGKSMKQQSIAGIRATRMNAQLLIQVFGDEANSKLPKSQKEIKSLLNKNNVVILGALKYGDKETSDTTAAKLARYLNSKFINLTNISGLYTSNPKTNKKAKFIPQITWAKFEKIANKKPFKPGQHFILDQKSSKIIKKSKIPTYIAGPNLRNLQKLINNKPFKGTTIQG